MLKPRIATLRTERATPAKANVLRNKSRGAWDTLRERILQRDHGLCQPCQRASRLALAHEVDHICPVIEGGTDDESNLESICSPCHKAKTAEETKRRLGGCKP